MIADGAALLRHLDDARWDVSAAFWYCEDETNRWRLRIAAPEVDSKGVRHGYLRMIQALAELDPGPKDITLDDITVMSTTDRLVMLLSSYVSTGKSIRSIRVGQGAIQGQYVEDTFIYRMNAGVAASG